MRAIVLDRNYMKVEVLNGKIKGGVFSYSRAAWWDVTMIFVDKESIEFEYDKLVPVPRGGIIGGWEKVAYYMWDGKNLTQLSFSELQDASNVADYNTYWKIGEFAKANTLKKPFDLKDLVTWLAVIAVICGIAANIIATNSAVNGYKQAIAPFNATVHQNNLLELYNANQISKLTILMNKTLDVLNYTNHRLP